MIQIRKPDVSGPGPIMPDKPDKNQATDDKALFVLPKESGIDKVHNDVDSNSILMKTALKGLHVIPPNKGGEGWMARFYQSLIPWLK